MKGKMQGLPAAGPEEATQDEEDETDEAPEEMDKDEVSKDDDKADLADPEPEQHSWHSS